MNCIYFSKNSIEILSRLFIIRNDYTSFPKYHILKYQITCLKQNYAINICCNLFVATATYLFSDLFRYFMDFQKASAINNPEMTVTS